MNASGSESTISQDSGKTGMLGFTIIWIGQVLSLLGTSMTGFTLTIWAWRLTGQATALALVALFSFLPVVVISPIAGAVVDRYDRKKVMMLADFAAGLPTVAVLLLYSAGSLQIWHLFITGAVSGAFQAFHFPAYSAAVTMMLRKEQLGRANGMLATAQFVSMIFSPVIAALILSIAGFAGGVPLVLMFDITTFLFAISMLLFVHIPRPPVTEAGLKGMGSIWKESLYGFRYIYERSSLLGLQLTFFAVNLVGGFSNTLLAPLVLARTNDDQVILGSIMSAVGIGGLIGSILLIVWGGPKRKVHGVLFGTAALSLFGVLFFGLGHNVYTWALTAFLGMIFFPIINGSSQAIWQAKVAPDVQGRVFATRLLIAQISIPLAMVLTGPLADWVFEPAMMNGGSLTAVFGWLLGTGPGAGMALMFVITGILGVLVGLVAYMVPVIRNAEDILPDYGATGPQSAEETLKTGE
ncbi:MFS transporter [Candidatus Bathyarchaeota archaeon]|nr:MFS transporter [Candidatus Bathyarchaeota archaeon]